ncbi:MAG: ABC transporter permease [Alistipes sp.]|nr:ABC transporter permease [Alistipes sp.]
MILKYTHPLFNTFRREVQRAVASPTYLCSLTLLPILSTLFFLLFFSQNRVTEGSSEGLSRSTIKPFPIVLIDQDNTSLSRTFHSMLNASQGIYIDHTTTSSYDAKQSILRGECYGALLIPEGFEQACLTFGSTSISLYDSGTNLSANGFIAKSVQTTAESLSAGIRIESLQAQSLSAEQAMAEVMPIRFDSHLLFNPYLDYAWYLAPCFMAMMLIIFTIVATITALGSEIRYGTAVEWLATANNSLAIALIGKLLLITLAMVATSLIMAVVLFRGLNLPMQGNPAILAVATLTLILCYEGMGIFFVALTASMRLALSLGGGYSVLAFTFSGLTFPVMAMATPLKWLSNIFPYTLYTRILIDTTLRGAPIDIPLTDLAKMLLFWILPVIVIPRINKICRESRYWGRL